MTLETEDLLQSILDSLDRIDYIRPDDIPDIDLYGQPSEKCGP